MRKLSLNKAKLAFDLLEQEMEVVRKEELKQILGGIQRDFNGNIIFTATNTEAGFDSWGNYVTWTVGYILADNGTQITAYKNGNESYDGYDTDCHGTTFADGQYWINNDQACGIITGDGYTQVGYSSGGYSSEGYSSGGYAVGDVVVYYGSDGGVAHSLTITDFYQDGTPIVTGQGGIQIENSSTGITNGWDNYLYYEVYRK